MIRPSTILWIAAVILIGYAMFQVKYEVLQQEQQLARLDHAILKDRESIRVLNAEWSYLSQPTRLDQLAKRYLALAPIGTAQLLSNLDALPMRPGVASEGVGASGAAPGGTDQTSPPPHAQQVSAAPPEARFAHKAGVAP